MDRSLLFAILITLLCTAFRPDIAPKANDVTGNWKRSAMTVIDAKGKTTDVMKIMHSSMPCAKDIIYVFSSDGGVTSKVPESCGAMKKTLESSNTTGRWTMSGHKVPVTPTSKELPIATYDVSFQGNTMTWTFDYADNHNAPNPTKAKRMTITYQRV